MNPALPKQIMVICRNIRNLTKTRVGEKIIILNLKEEGRGEFR